MNVLVTGANGLLGQHLVLQLLQKKHYVSAVGRGPSRLDIQDPQYTYYSVDISNGREVSQLIYQVKPSIVIHTAAMTQVDECELNPEQCERVNVQGTAQLLADTEAIGSHFIYISTDFVFDGTVGNYAEEDELKPISWYGFTKMQAEALVEASELPWTIIRTCLVYGKSLQGTRNNIVTWVKESLEQGKKIKVVDDQWRTPTYVEDLAKGIILAMEKKAKGIFHISGKDLLTPFDIAMETAAICGLDKSKVEKVTAATFTQPGRRPPKTGFNIQKARKELGFEPMNFKDALRSLFLL